MKGDFRLVIVDNTPDPYYKPFYYNGGLLPRVPGTFLGQFDGVSSGFAYNYALSLCTSDMIGMVDPDMFWFQPNLVDIVQEDYYENGYMSVGCAGFYNDFQSIFDVTNPTHSGDKAAVLWGQFMDRKLALSEDWCCYPPGVGQITGWKVREKIIDQNIKREVIPGFYKDGETFFGWNQEKPMGCHFLKGCGSRAHIMQEIVPPVLEREKAKWM